MLQRRELATQLDLEGSFKKRQEVHIFGSLPATELFSLARIFVICRSPSFAVNIETTELAVFRGKLTDVNKALIRSFLEGSICFCKLFLCPSVTDL